jgi:hypothetical protein
MDCKNPKREIIEMKWNEIQHESEEGTENEKLINNFKILYYEQLHILYAMGNITQCSVQSSLLNLHCRRREKNPITCLCLIAN